MKIEKLNENQIRCTLTSLDLSMRNLNLGELAYGSDKVKRLFQEMIQKAHSELGFELDGMPVMIEAMPLSDESVTLVITKMEEPEEVDTRFSRFTPEGDDFNIFDISQDIEGADSLEGFADCESRGSIRVYVFNSIDEICEAAGAIGHSYVGDSVLYKNTQDKKYYLLLDGTGCNETIFASTCNVLSEYGRAVRNNYSSKAYFKEHYELIIDTKALEVLSKI
jgi:adapter protein MecA 1/2